MNVLEYIVLCRPAFLSVEIGLGKLICPLAWMASDVVNRNESLSSIFCKQKLSHKFKNFEKIAMLSLIWVFGKTKY